MSVLRKIPYIESKISALTEEQVATLKSVINSANTGDSYYSLIDNNNLLRTYLDSAKIEAIVLQLDKDHQRSGFVIYNGTWCVFLAYNRFQDMIIYDIDLTNNTYKEIKENLTIEELRRVLAEISGGGAELTPEALLEVLEGSDYISVDLNESETKVIIELDETLVDDTPTEASDNLVKSGGVFDALSGKLDASKQAVSNVGGLVTPTQAPTDTVLVSVETDREQSQVYLGTGLELGNSTSPYNMNVVGVADVRTGNEIKIWTGTQAQYDAITTKSNTTVYYILEA